MSKPRILVLDAQNINSLAFTRELGSKGYFIGTAGTSYLSLSFFSNYSMKKHILPPYKKSEQYVSSICDLAKKYNYNIIVPLSLESYVMFSENRHLINESIKIILPPVNGMSTASNKYKTFAYAKTKGVGIPKTFIVDKTTVKNLGPFLKEVGFPVVIKGSLSGVDNLRYCNTVSDLVSAIENLLGKESKIVCQEYVVGKTHGFYAYYNEGQLHSFFMHQRIKQYPLTGGPSSVARSYYDNNLVELSKKILDGLNWNGPAMVEYKFDSQSEEYKLIEINPKFWGSLDLTIEAGVNIPLAMIKHAMNEKFHNPKKYKDIYFRWLFPNEFLHYFSSNFRHYDFVKDIPIKTNIYRADILPSIFQIVLSSIKLITLLIRGSLKYPSGKPLL